MEERRLDLAEKNVYQALTSDDPSRRDAASFFTLRNSGKAKRRGWITSASAGDDLSMTVKAPVEFTVCWGTPRLPGADDMKTIEHDR